MPDAPPPPPDASHWYLGGFLPHCDAPGRFPAITYRLADSIPASEHARLREALASLPEEEREREHRRRLEELLDAGHGSCALAHPAVAELVASA
jgi:hypothetical protein